MTSLNVITTNVINDFFCWKDKRIGGEQIACKVSLCHFHAMKIWSEHFFPVFHLIGEMNYCLLHYYITIIISILMFKTFFERLKPLRN